MTGDEELNPSKLGTKAHWDQVYEREVRVFNDVGDEGEVWFGESSIKKMRDWVSTHVSSNPSPPTRILECGSGNGTLLLSFLTSKSGSAQDYHLTGIDYSPGAIELARAVEKSRRIALKNGSYESAEGSEDEDVEREGPGNGPSDSNGTTTTRVINHVLPVDWRVGDLLTDTMDETWDLVLDKGTFDALCLSNTPVKGTEGKLPSQVYPEKVSQLVKEGGYFLITSCNFTEEEIKRRWTKDGLGFRFHSSVPHPTYTFGGKKGSVVCTVALQKVTPASSANGSAANGVHAVNGSLNGSKPTELFLCIDAGGTKTEAAIGSEEGVLARATGGTGNMAEVGAQLCYEIISTAVLEAIEKLPAQYRPSVSQNGGSTNVCPVKFADVWVGISGCDTPLDQERMSELLGPFFSISDLPILNDAHLLGGALLTHHCPWGVAVIAGTGSIVVALEQDKEGTVLQTGRRGGFGYLLGDDGSSFDLGRCAIRAAADAFDAGEEDPHGLAGKLAEHFGVNTTGEILGKVHELDPTLSPLDSANIRKLQISSLARPVIEAFNASPLDPIAALAVEEATRPLIKSIVSIVKQNERSTSELTGEWRSHTLKHVPSVYSILTHLVPAL
ncbi:hypothetical protein BD324DRAFT_635196 [Kockovaella imperatae]|uniref:Protein-lysine N-methyltransferase EFM4 n=1 Tax=Kockovaella imperatae TaxID=4999 RepID=A0A1Y1UBG3_9TREE|nr:hypothetical protein BD324DRAFT_635196 [Kockovaella imperatae]ORX34826.1 hypothetical protein BD324DRAFT_635196 [Kockovaella imperatae]